MCAVLIDYRSMSVGAATGLYNILVIASHQMRFVAKTALHQVFACDSQIILSSFTNCVYILTLYFGSILLLCIFFCMLGWIVCALFVFREELVHRNALRM